VLLVTLLASARDLDGFIDTLVRRIASFACRAIAGPKNLDKVSLPSVRRRLEVLNSFQVALA
jgi:hypothetical protein